MKRIISTSLLFITVISLLGSAFPRDVSALTSLDWQPGNIIDDFSFTNANSMSVQDIQNFLDTHITCDTYGTQISEFGGGTRAQYGTAHNNPAPFTCLNNYYEVPKTAPSSILPTNNYGQATPPAGSISAAQIIANAAQKNSISPKVLLVKLATESPGPLTSDTWPFLSQFTYAMGSHCPDTGPNGSANCDPNYAGFSIQVDEAAKLLRGYLDNMSQPWWTLKKPYQTNSIYWNVPSTGCGSSDVYIQNKATAALYTYTPYQPNQAALNNLHGTGDRCSAYGNRNFWVVYNNFFGGRDYDWNVYDQAAYSDSSRTKRLSYTPSIQPGTTIYMQIKAINTGRKTWDQMTRLVTTSPVGRPSIFYDSSDWLINNRPATPQELTVPPGGTGTFNFTMKAPSLFQTYYEHFDLVQDGVQLFPDIGQNFTIDVTPVVTEQRAVTTPFGVNSYLKPGQTILSADSNSVLTMQPDGNLVLRNGFRTTWQTNTAGNPSSMLVLQSDGNLVLYDKSMRALWSTTTQGTTSNSLNLQSDANLVLYGTTSPTWSSGTNTPQSQYSVVYPRLGASQLLYPGQRIETADRQRMLILQSDGNLVLYDKSMRALWNSQTNGKSIRFLAMQSDGNLVLYDTTATAVWASGTDGNGISRLVIQDDSNLVIYRDDGRAVWATYTNR